VIDQQKFERALREGGHIMSQKDLVDAARSGRVRAFFENDSFLLVSMGSKQQMIFHIVVGDLPDVFIAADRAYEWGRSQGANRAVFIGRTGWAKVLKGEGWRVVNDLKLYERSL